MRNRAKCKLCKDVLESFHRHDFVTCKCGEISIDGGSYHFSASAKDFTNFLRIDDNDNEVAVKFQESEVLNLEPQSPKEDVKITTKTELSLIVEEMIKNIENLPQHAQAGPISHYDHMSILLLLQRFLKLED